jgi:hypothetical protein
MISIDDNPHTINRQPPSHISSVLSGIQMQRIETPQPDQVSTDDDNNTIEIWPILARLANHRNVGLAGELRVWFALWNYLKSQRGGQDWCELDYQQLQAITGYKRAHLRRLLKSGYTGIIQFWRIEVHHDNAEILRIIGQRKLSAAIARLADERGVYDPYERERGKVHLPESILLAGGADYLAHCFAAWLLVARDNERMITWSYLMQSIGRSQNTIRDWINRAGILVTENYAVKPTALPRAAIPQYNAHREDLSIPGAPHFYRYNVSSRIVEAVWQRGNTYTCMNSSPVRLAGLGMMHDLNTDKNQAWRGAYMTSSSESLAAAGLLSIPDRECAQRQPQNVCSSNRSISGRRYKRNNYCIGHGERAYRNMYRAIDRRVSEQPQQPVYRLSAEIVYADDRRGRSYWRIEYQPPVDGALAEVV